MGCLRQRLNAFGEHLQAKLRHHPGLPPPHGRVCRIAEDVDRLMAATDPAVRPAVRHRPRLLRRRRRSGRRCCKKHVARVVHVHCKDVRAGVIRQTRNESLSFLDGVLNGTFTVPGDGDLDFEAVLSVLHEAGYEGWLVVEAEQDPAVAPSYAYAKKGYETLRGIVDRIGTAQAEVH
jgi:inosose dehydratase